MKMNYFVVGTNNIDASVKFYNSLFEDTEFNQVGATERMVFWQGEDFIFAVAIPFNEAPASYGNGTMVGFNVDSTEEVQQFHKKVLDLGGLCEGEPGPRGPRFSAYVRDLDNNKICFFK